MRGSLERSDRVAQCAVLAMLFELSSSPKPGNVDRCHDFSDIRFHHFLTSAVSAYPVFRKAASSEGSPGSLILEGVAAWGDWNLRSNTHFGSLVLLIPLVLAAGRMAGHEQGQETKQDESQENGPDDGVDNGLEEELARVLRSTTVQDAIDFYRAFDLAGARVVQVDDFSLKDPDWERKLIEGNQSLLELMRLSLGHDIVAREWATDFERSFQLAGRLREMVSIYGLNDGVVRTFLEALAEVPDSLISAKFGKERAVEVSRMAIDALLDSTLNKAREMDCELNNRDMNPGSTADLIAASLFISLLRRLRF
ncbi:triphosphoribosyl-dephospho-CoA synthase [Methanothrix soehngenii]|uniref:triphosphoribosyl-dephospho-CoA synthase n=1 Tax=Methanothrix soehngenii TaxID=2223 RepID=UPI0023EFFFC4|nr:triphosphoribosyl-dephospho-CoA synthase [Methanothrix soehngenii]MCK9586997.1 triphosphoribosyl-dephospho-CoA synthase [Methanothrix soehngenii]MDD4488321.1 triphosphoribosyl-dephospho-CoA synthase [Methanothrix soehngenii]